MKDDAKTFFSTPSKARDEGEASSLGVAGIAGGASLFEAEFNASVGLDGSAGGCSVGCGWVEGVELAVRWAFEITGLGAETLAGLLDPLLSTCTFFLPQLADDGSAEPSPLSLRLMGSSRLPWRAMDCDVVDTAWGAFGAEDCG